jgi:hypothetical protein
MPPFAARSVTARHWRSAALIGATLAIGVLGPAQGASAAPGKSLHAKLLGVFAFGPCPADVPAGAACLHDEVSGALKDAGTVDGHFDVVIDAAHANANGVAPIAKRGSFVAPDGDRLDVRAAGSFDFTTSTARYTYTVAGGTGRFARASGTGTWLVPAPAVFDAATGRGEGDEFLDGTLELHGGR